MESFYEPVNNTPWLEPLVQLKCLQTDRVKYRMGTNMPTFLKLPVPQVPRGVQFPSENGGGYS